MLFFSKRKNIPILILPLKIFDILIIDSPTVLRFAIVYKNQTLPSTYNTEERTKLKFRDRNLNRIQKYRYFSKERKLYKNSKHFLEEEPMFGCKK